MMTNQQVPSTPSKQQARDYLGEVDMLTRDLDEDVMLVLTK
jgi:hypothetical protein